jgi:alanine dehydrogenase
MPKTESILFLKEEDVKKSITVSRAIDLAEMGIRADAEGKVAGNKFYMPVGDHGFVKPFSGYINGEEYFFVKTFSFFPGNPERIGHSATSSMVLLFDAESGLPVCLMEAGWVTALKTAASTTVTASRLAKPESDCAVIFGIGSLGQMHLRALTQRFSLKQIYVIDIRHEVAETLARELASELSVNVYAVSLEEREAYVRQADMIITVTTGNQPLISRKWLKQGVFVARLGSYQEVELDVITEVDKVVVDDWHYVSPRIPELIQLSKEGRFGFQDVYAEWPEIVAGRKPGRENSKEVITYIALGIWGEYAAILPEVYRSAVELGLGQRLPS